MLNKPVDEIVMEGGHVVGVKSEGEVMRYGDISDTMMSLGLFTHQRSPVECRVLIRSHPSCRWLAVSSSSATPATSRTAFARRVRWSVWSASWATPLRTPMTPTPARSSFLRIRLTATQVGVSSSQRGWKTLCQIMLSTGMLAFVSSYNECWSQWFLACGSARA